MSETMSLVQAQLLEAGYSVATAESRNGPVLLFENGSILGFVLHFRDAAALLKDWRTVSAQVLQAAQFALRRAEAKSWNAYLVLLTETPGDYGQNITLGAIEEDLVATRKIARAGVSSQEAVRSALLPLLPVQSAPRLEAVDMASEIRLRTSELPVELVEAFLSGASDTVLAQLLEAGAQLHLEAGQ